MIFCKELNKGFADKKAMFKALKAKKEEIIGLKCSKIKKSGSVDYCFKDASTVKGDDSSEPLKIGDTIKVAMNTTNYFDHDRDVLANGSWTKTAKEQNGKTYHAVGHKLELGNIVAYPKDVSISVENIEWNKLGKNYSGKTEVLVFNSKITDKTNNDAFLAYRDGEDIKHSISLIYVKIKLAIDSLDPEDKEEKAVYDAYYPSIANKEDVDEVGYFWHVAEAKIHREGSTVLFPANDATTEIKEEVITEPDNSTQKQNNQPEKSTDDKTKNFYLSLLKN